jgi:RHS repeat-associated protein
MMLNNLLAKTYTPDRTAETASFASVSVYIYRNTAFASVSVYIYRNTAFGEQYLPVTQISEGLTQRFTFQGREASGIAGAPMYYRFRQYSTGLGRFAQRDRVLDANLYAGMNGNMVNHMDPMGLWKIKRLGEGYAHAVAEEGDTLDGLAVLLRLEASEAGGKGGWLRKFRKDGTAAEITSKPSDPIDITPGCEYAVPNEIFILVGKAAVHARGFLADDAEGLAAAAKKKGFMARVMDLNIANSITLDPAAGYKLVPMRTTLWGFAYFGHGFIANYGIGNSPLEKEWRGQLAPFGDSGKFGKFSSGSVGGFIEPGNLSRPFHKAFLVALGCYTSSQYWHSAISPNGFLATVEGFDVAPFGIHNLDWSRRRAQGPTWTPSRARPNPGADDLGYGPSIDYGAEWDRQVAAANERARSTNWNTMMDEAAGAAGQ